MKINKEQKTACAIVVELMDHWEKMRRKYASKRKNIAKKLYFFIYFYVTHAIFTIKNKYINLLIKQTIDTLFFCIITQYQ